MKNRYLLSVAALAMATGWSSPTWAQEQGRVISSTPVIQQVAVPRQVCTTEQVVSSTPANKSGAGALIGGVAGGAVGNAMGKGNGRAAATAIGIFGGAILGNHLEGGKPETTAQNVQRCNTQTFYENRTAAYNVVYEFNGKQYQVQLPQDPGPFVQLSVTPVTTPVPAPAPVQPAPVLARPVTQAPVHTQPVVVETSTVFVQQPPLVYVAPAPVVYRPAARVVYGVPHAHSHLHPHLQVQHLAYPRLHASGTKVSVGYNTYWR